MNPCFRCIGAVRSAIASRRASPRSYSTSSGIPTLVHAGETTTPIEHVVVIVGENRSFDHLFGTYVPRRGETVWNLLSKGIITAEGTPGPHFGPETIQGRFEGTLEVLAGPNLENSLRNVAAAQYRWNPFRRRRLESAAFLDTRLGNRRRGKLAVPG